MIEKTSGRVSYAVLGFGGFLGIGNDHYPLPWNNLKYDTELGAIGSALPLKQLNGAPKYADESSWNWADETRHKSVDDYYGARATHSALGSCRESCSLSRTVGPTACG